MDNGIYPKINYGNDLPMNLLTQWEINNFYFKDKITNKDAVDYASLPVLKILKSYNVNIPSNAANFAITTNNADKLQWLLENGIYPNNHIIEVFYNNSSQLIKNLLSLYNL